MKTKKAQLKIQQMAFMLIAVTIFFVLVGMFVLVIQLSSLKESAAILEERNSLLLVTKLANSPEFSCGNAFGNKEPNCIDADKVMMLKERIENYDNFWGVENIQIITIYPESKIDVECSLENYPNCNIIKLRDEKISSENSNFVSLCRKQKSAETSESEDICTLAKLIVSYNGN